MAEIRKMLRHLLPILLARFRQPAAAAAAAAAAALLLLLLLPMMLRLFIGEQIVIDDQMKIDDGPLRLLISIPACILYITV